MLSQTATAQGDFHYELSNDGSATLVINTPNYRAAANPGNHLATLPVGTQVEVLATRNDPGLGQLFPWSQIRVLNGPHQALVGWVSGRTIHRKPGKADPPRNAHATDAPPEQPPVEAFPPNGPDSRGPSQQPAPPGPKSYEGLNDLRDEIAGINSPTEIPRFPEGTLTPPAVDVIQDDWGNHLSMDGPNGTTDIWEYKGQNGDPDRIEVRQENVLSQDELFDGFVQSQQSVVQETIFENGTQIATDVRYVDSVQIGNEHVGVKFEGSVGSNGILSGGAGSQTQASAAFGPYNNIDGREEWLAGTIGVGHGAGAFSTSHGDIVHSQGLQIPGVAGYNYSHSPRGSNLEMGFTPPGQRFDIGVKAIETFHGPRRLPR